MMLSLSSISISRRVFSNLLSKSMGELGGRYHVESKNSFFLYLLISVLKSSIPWVFKSGLSRLSTV